MSGLAQREQTSEVGRGPLSRAAAVIYRLLVLEGLLLVTCSPTLLVMLLLDRDPSNLPLAALSLLPVAPALVAGVAAVRASSKDDDLAPARPYLRAYRRELGPTLRWWVPAVAVLAVLTFNLVHLDAVAGGPGLRPVLFLVTAVAVIWCAHMVVLTAMFHFRTRDAARVALAEIVPQWRFSAGVLGLLVVAGTTLVWSELVALGLLFGFAGLLALMAQPLVADVTARFTRRD